MHRTSTKFAFSILIYLLFPLFTQAQSDCSTAVPVCDDSDIIMDPSGLGFDDFANAANDAGCLASDEDNSYWLEITFSAAMPANTTLAFTATTMGAGSVDTDFAMWGPNPDCNSLGSPLRCNFSASDIAGLGSGDSGYAPVVLANPGETYLILVNDYAGDGGPMILDWDNSPASAFFVCCNGVVDVGPDITVCEGGTFTLSGASFVGGSGAETFAWTSAPPVPGAVFSPSNTVLNPTITLPAGQAVNVVCTITVTDGTCIYTDSITINTLPPPTPTGGDLTFCAGGSVSLDPGFFTGGYQWSPGGQVSQTITVNAPGAYTVTVTDANNCTGEATFNVTETPPLNINITGGPEFCQGGTVNITATAGYTYVWSPGGETTQTITVATAGTYTVVATTTDGSGCTGTASITITEAADQNINIDPSGVLCNNNGSIQLDAGLGAGFAYNWSPAGNTEVITITMPGTYDVTATDNSSGCTYTGSITITEEPPLTPQIDGDLAFCTGTPTVLSVSGGNFVAPYAWTSGSGNSAAATISVSAPGLVSVTVTDANGCTGETSVNVTENPLPNTNVTGDLTICAAGNTMTTLDAGAGFSYNWSAPGGNGQTLNVNQTGTYTVTITDGNGCENQASATVTLSPAPMPSITGDLFICPSGSSNTSTTLDAGIGFDAYVWSPTGDNTQTTTANSTGNYTVTVTDNLGCEGEQTVNVDAFNTQDPVIIGDDLICEGTSTPITATGSFMNYAWSLPPGGTTQTVSVPIGTYTVTATDDNGCETTDDFTINEAPPVIVQINPANPMICAEGNTTILLDAGAFPVGYTYTWASPPGGNTQTIIANTLGDCSVTVTSDEGCIGVDIVEITEAPAPAPFIDGNLNICEGDPTTLSVTAGFETYSWSTNETGTAINVDAAGTYEITVTNIAGCEGTAEVMVNTAPAPEVTIDGEDFCAGSNSLLEASATGGSSFDYLWGNGIMSNFNAVFTPGTYSVTVTNEFDCEGEASIEIEELTLAPPVISGNLTICEGEETVLSLVDFANYDEVTWSDGSMGATITVSTASTITVDVGNNGCTATAEVDVMLIPIDELTITGETEICDGATITLVANGDFIPATIVWSDISGEVGIGQTLDITTPGTYTLSGQNAGNCLAESEPFVVSEQTTNITITGIITFCEGMSTELTVTDGFASYAWTYMDENGVMQNETVNTNTFTGATAGIYSVVATTASGCSGEDDIELFINLNPVISIGGSATFCTGSQTPLIANVEFNSGDYTYDWSGAGTGNTQSITANVEGSYTVLVTDINNCVASASTEITEQDELSPVISGDLAFCENGSITLDVGNNYATQTWSTGEMTPSIEISEVSDGQESITVFVTDAFGCSGEAEVQVIENPLPNVAILGEEQFCANDSASVAVNDVFLTYNWSNGGTGNSTFVTADGIIEVTVTDENTCVNEAAFVVEMLALPIPEIDGELSFCPDTQTTLFGEVGFDNYEWSGAGAGASAELLVTAPGDYTLEVIDAFGCIGTNVTQVVNFEVEIPQITGDLSFCPDNTTTLQASNLNADYTYVWSTTDFGNEITVAEAGIYTVTATDANNCITTAVEETALFIVTDPEITGDDEFCTGENVTLAAGNNFVTYLWSDDNNSASQSIEITNGGQFEVSVVDNNGCESSNTFIVEEHALPEVQIGGSSSYCIGSFTTINAGAIYANYTWSTGSNENSIQVNSIGSVTLSVIDEFGCPGEDTVEIQEDTELSPVISGLTDFCEGANTILDAGDFEIYVWRNDAGDIVADTRFLTIDSAGTYSLYVEDVSGCIGNASTPVVQNPLPTPEITGVFEFCVGESTILDIGDEFTVEEWSTGSLNAMITVNAPGLYAVEVSNEFGCLESTSIEVLERALPVFTIEGIDFFCENEATVIEVSNPSPTDTYLWTDAVIENTTTVSVAGPIGLTVTNEFGCEQAEQILIDEITLPIAIAGDDQNLDCAVLTANIGSTTSSFGDEYTYLWTGPGITPANENLLQPEVGIDGQYTLVIVDTVHNCISELAMTEITDLAYVPNVELGVDGIIDCVTAEVMIDASNSTSGQSIQYNWFKDGNVISTANGMDISVEEEGMYSLEVMDTETQCMNADSIQVEENIDAPTANAGISPGILTCDVLELTLDASASETGTEISYQWSGNISTGITTLQPTVGEPGLYILTVTNGENGCISTANVSVQQNIVPPNAEAGDTQEIDCHVETVTIDGTGTSFANNFIHQWTFNGNEITADNLVFEVESPGIYEIFVQNTTNGCTSQDQVIITIDENTPSAFEYAPGSPTCAGDDDGSIQVSNVTGGLSPILYSINGEAFTSSPSFQNLTGGSYLITIQDVEGCEYEEMITLEDGNDLTLDLGDDIYINLGEFANIEAEVNLDDPEVASIIWQTTDSINCVNDCLVFSTQPFATTPYQVTVIDENNCSRTDELTVFVNKPRDVFVPNAFSPNGDGNNDILQVFSGIDVKVVHSFLIFNRWGEPVFQVYNFPSNDPAFGWNGAENGKVFNTQVFTYFAEVEFIDGEIVLFKGDVVLMK